MKVISVNGSPRKMWNTATLLQKALDGAKSKGADTELIHLYDLNFKGCTSCFACKRKSSMYIGHCAKKDDLSDVLEKISECDVLILGSPIYLSNISGAMQSFLERLLFSNITYSGQGSVFKGKVSSGFIYTMGISEDFMKKNNYEDIFRRNQGFLKILNGNSEYLFSTDTYQFDDYSKYEAAMWDEKHKAQVKTEQFPMDCQKAFDMGARLAMV